MKFEGVWQIVLWSRAAGVGLNVQAQDTGEYKFTSQNVKFMVSSQDKVCTGIRVQTFGAGYAKAHTIEHARRST
jgi:hypothetical protein